MKLNIEKKEEKHTQCYRVSVSTIRYINQLRTENKCSRGQVIDYAIKSLINGTTK
jgi:hypothetical protein